MTRRAHTPSSRRTRRWALVGALVVASGCVAQLPNGLPEQDSGGLAPMHPAVTSAGDASTPAMGAVSASCGNLNFDPRNCGTCGHDCGGGACGYGTCTSLAPGVLASGQSSPHDLTIDAVNVYWLNESPPSLLKCAKQGCNNRPTVLTSGGWNAVGRLAVDATNVYFTADDAVLACSVDGCPSGPTVLWHNSGQFPGPIAVDALRVYATDSAVVFSCAKGGCQAVPTLEWPPQAQPPPDPTGGYTPTALGADTTTLYGLLTQGEVMAFAPGQAASMTSWLVSGQLGLVDMAIDDTDVFLASQDASSGRLVKCAKTGCGNQTTPLASALASAARIATDGADVYISEWGDVGQGTFGPNLGRIGKCPVNGCLAGTRTLLDYLSFPVGIAVDDKYVYFSDSGSVGQLDGSPDARIVAVPK